MTRSTSKLQSPSRRKIDPCPACADRDRRSDRARHFPASHAPLDAARGAHRCNAKPRACEGFHSCRGSVHVPNGSWLVARRHRSLTRCTFSPSVVTARTDFIQPTHQLDRVLRLAVLDEGEDVAFRLEVNSMAIFKRSCSTFKRS